MIIFAEENRNKKHKLEMKRLANAEKYYLCKVCETVMRSWNKRAVLSHSTRYNTATSIFERYEKIRVLKLWESAYRYQGLLQKQMEIRAFKYRKRSIVRWSLRWWKSSVDVTKRERMIEERVAEKWQEVQKWLETYD